MQTVNIGGKERPIKIGFNTLAEFGRRTGITLSELQHLGETLTIANTITLIWCILKDGARKEGIDFTTEIGGKQMPIDEFIVGDWLDEDPNIIAEIMDYYGESQAPVDEEKKNVKANPPKK